MLITKKTTTHNSFEKMKVNSEKFCEQLFEETYQQYETTNTTSHETFQTLAVKLLHSVIYGIFRKNSRETAKQYKM